MKLLYGDNTFCDQQTFKRLMVIADEICFADRPSVTLGNGGTIGHASPYRNLKSDGEPVRITVFEPPSGPAKDFYLPYIEADLANPQFITTVIDGLTNSLTFASKLIQLQANYRPDVSGEMVRIALIADKAIPHFAFRPEIDHPSLLFDVSTQEGRIATFKTILFDASIRLTGTTFLAESFDASPVSDDRYFSKLLALRSSSPSYLGGTASVAPYLGFELVKSVIPDAVLEHLKATDILEYRRKSADAYRGWEIELNRLATKLDGVPLAKAREAVPGLIAREFQPKAQEYQNELIGVRDQLFGDLVKQVAKIDYKNVVPAISIAYLTGNLIDAAAAFAAMTIPRITPPIVDYIKGRRATKRKHAISYLIDLAKAG